MLSLSSIRFDITTRAFVSTRRLLKYVSHLLKLLDRFSLVDFISHEELGVVNCLSEPLFPRESLWKTSVSTEVNSEVTLLGLRVSCLSNSVSMSPAVSDDLLRGGEKKFPELLEQQLASCSKFAFPVATWLKAKKEDALSGFVDIFLRAVLACSLRCLFKKESFFRICEVYFRFAVKQ